MADNQCMVRISVIIPTFGRPAKLANCLSALAASALPADQFEVLVGVDGADDGVSDAGNRAWRDAGGRDGGLFIEAAPWAGLAAVRNRLLPRAKGDVLLFFNDDVRAQPGCLGAHLAAQERFGGESLVVGDAPWVIHEPDRLFDRMIRETSMVFFYDKMRGSNDPARDWGFRHAWPLNLSAPAGLVRAAKGFTVFPTTYGFEDDEFAWRLSKEHGTAVRFEPGAVVEHDHRMEPDDYLRREYTLGYAAVGFAKTAPRCAEAMFRRDILSDEEISYNRANTQRDLVACGHALTTFRNTAAIAADAINGPHAAHILQVHYQHHLPLKRHVWRRGHLDAIDGREKDHTAVLTSLEEAARG